MSKWWPSIIAAGTAAGSIFIPVIQGFFSAHPTVTAVVAAVGVILAHVLPSPVATPPKE